MKMQIAALTFLMFTIAQAETLSNVDPVKGHWTVESRTCSSGVPAYDGFVIGRDEMTIGLFDGKYDAHVRVKACHYWVTGQYNTQGNMLRIFNMAGASNCTQQGPAQEASIVYAATEGKLKLYAGPFGPGGPCPPRDLLESTFRAF